MQGLSDLKAQKNKTTEMDNIGKYSDLIEDGSHLLKKNLIRVIPTEKYFHN